MAHPAFLCYNIERYCNGRMGLMLKEDIRIKQVIVHILDSTVGLPVLSDSVIDFGSDFADFLREHIYRIVAGDDSKDCEFYKEQSEIYQMMKEYDDDRFVPMSKQAAELLYGIMNSNIDIPPADLVVVRFKARDEEFLAFLKMNFKTSYTHRTLSEGEGNYNEIIRYKSILPTETQRLQEAAVIDLQTFGVRLIEKKYEVNGEKTNYFSYLFLKCSSHLSPKSKLSIVTKAVENIQKENCEEYKQYEEHMRAKSIIQEELVQNGGFVVEEIAEKIFADQPELKTAFQEKMEKYDMVKEEVQPQNDTTVRKYQKQYLLTDTGIEIKIPMDQYKDTGKVEFITQADGSISVLLKNIGHIQAKF